MKSSLLLISFFLCFSCTSRMNLDVKSVSSTICIYGYLQSYSSFQTIELTSTSPFFSDSINKPVSDADVILTSSDNDIYKYVYMDQFGLYRSIIPFTSKPLMKYHWCVKYDIDGDGIVEKYEADTKVGRSIKLDTMICEYGKTLGKGYYSAKLYFNEPKGEDYYLYRFFLNDSLVSRKVSKLMTWSDKLFDGEYINGRAFFKFNCLADIDKYTEEEKEENFFIKKGDVVKMEGGIVEESFYDFILQCHMKKQGENPFFGGPSANIITNITNGGVGYFGVFNSAFASTKIIDGPDI